MEPENQGQHEIGQVYLKMFAFENFDIPVICVWKKGDNFSSLKNIKSFNKRNNYFDLPSITAIDARTFEKLNGELETEYPKIIQEIQSNGKLSERSECFLKQFVANMLCRTEFMRRRIEGFYNDPSTKDKLLDEIAYFIPESTAAIRNVDNIAPKDRLNYLMLFVMRHFNHILQRFRYSILKDFDNHGWVTSDNPVILENNGRHGVLLPLEAEIYFPLSNTYCLYMHHKHSEDKRSSLRNIPHGDIVEATEEIHKMILYRMPENANEYVIFPWYFARGTNLSSENIGQTGVV